MRDQSDGDRASASVCVVLARNAGAPLKMRRCPDAAARRRARLRRSEIRPTAKMMDVSRHRSNDTLRGYKCNAEILKDHPAAALGA
jgi:hypothetical protein